MTTSKSGQRKFLPWLLLAVSPAAAFLLVECFTHNPFIILTFPVALWNILFYELIYLFIYALTHSIGVSCLAGDVIFFVIGLANYYIVSFRSNPIVPWDIYSLRTAASVAGNFDYMPSPEAWLCIGGFAALLLMAVVLLWSKAGHKKQKKKKRKSTVRGGWKPAVLGRLFPAMLIVLTLCGYVKLLHQDAFVKALKLDNTLFTPFYMSRKDGFTTSFLMDLKYLKAEEPEGYDPAEEEALLAEIEEEEAVLTPNIIVVMDEAFSDPAILGEFKTNQDYMPFVHALQQGAENTQTGTLNVSVKGGNTANTEYELLTGHSMRFLPGGCVPYQQYIFGPRDSLVWWLDELGYQTTAIHPFNPSGWNRDKVYPWLGFDQALFNTSFINPERIRKYIDDEACFDKIVEVYENKPAGLPLFCLAVTMQNHSGYFEDFDNFDVDVHAEDGDSRILDRYLSLMKLSDEALEELIHYFEGQEEPTMVIFFGDHQPNDVVVEPVWKLNGKSGKNLSEEDADKRYQVPYVIWANYDIEEKQGEETSVNYLAGKILKEARVPLSAFLQLQQEYEAEIPVLSTQRAIAADGTELTEEQEETSASLNAYRKMQYYRMYDQEDASVD